MKVFHQRLILFLTSYIWVLTFASSDSVLSTASCVLENYKAHTQMRTRKRGSIHDHLKTRLPFQFCQQHDCGYLTLLHLLFLYFSLGFYSYLLV